MLGALIEFRPKSLVKGCTMVNFTSVVVDRGIAMETGQVGGISNLKGGECVDQHEQSELGSASLLSENVLVEQEVSPKENDERLQIDSCGELCSLL